MQRLWAGRQFREVSIVAFLPDRLLPHVRDVLGERDLVVAKSWDEVHTIVREKPVTAIILDPSADGSMNVEAVELILNRYPSLPIVAYVSLSEARSARWRDSLAQDCRTFYFNDSGIRRKISGKLSLELGETRSR